MQNEDYDAVLCDLFGTLVDDRGNAIAGALAFTQSLPVGRWAVVTSCGARLAKQLIAHSGIAVPDVVISSDDVARQKPDPAGYLRAAQVLQVVPARCLVIEDSAHGAQAARAAGMDVIRVGMQTTIAALRVAVKENGTIAVR